MRLKFALLSRSFLEVTNEKIFKEFLQFIYKSNQEKGKSEIEILVTTKQLLDLCNKNGFTSWEKENDFQLYELPKSVIDQITHL